MIVPLEEHPTVVDLREAVDRHTAEAALWAKRKTQWELTENVLRGELRARRGALAYIRTTLHREILAYKEALYGAQQNGRKDDTVTPTFTLFDLTKLAGDDEDAQRDAKNFEGLANLLHKEHEADKRRLQEQHKADIVRLEETVAGLDLRCAALIQQVEEKEAQIAETRQHLTSTISSSRDQHTADLQLTSRHNAELSARVAELEGDTTLYEADIQRHTQIQMDLNAALHESHTTVESLRTQLKVSREKFDTASSQYTTDIAEREAEVLRTHNNHVEEVSVLQKCVAIHEESAALLRTDLLQARSETQKTHQVLDAFRSKPKEEKVVAKMMDGTSQTEFEPDYESDEEPNETKKPSFEGVVKRVKGLSHSSTKKHSPKVGDNLLEKEIKSLKAEHLSLKKAKESDMLEFLKEKNGLSEKVLTVQGEMAEVVTSYTKEIAQLKTVCSSLEHSLEDMTVQLNQSKEAESNSKSSETISDIIECMTNDKIHASEVLPRLESILAKKHPEMNKWHSIRLAATVQSISAFSTVSPDSSLPDDIVGQLKSLAEEETHVIPSLPQLLHTITSLCNNIKSSTPPTTAQTLLLLEGMLNGESNPIPLNIRQGSFRSNSIVSICESEGDGGEGEGEEENCAPQMSSPILRRRRDSAVSVRRMSETSPDLRRLSEQKSRLERHRTASFSNELQRKHSVSGRGGGGGGGSSRRLSLLRKPENTVSVGVSASPELKDIAVETTPEAYPIPRSPSVDEITQVEISERKGGDVAKVVGSPSVVRIPQKVLVTASRGTMTEWTQNEEQKSTSNRIDLSPPPSLPPPITERENENSITAITASIALMVMIKMEVEMQRISMQQQRGVNTTRIGPLTRMTSPGNCIFSGLLEDVCNGVTPEEITNKIADTFHMKTESILQPLPHSIPPFDGKEWTGNGVFSIADRGYGVHSTGRLTVWEDLEARVYALLEYIAERRGEELAEVHAETDAAECDLAVEPSVEMQPTILQNIPFDLSCIPDAHRLTGPYPKGRTGGKVANVKRRPYAAPAPLPLQIPEGSIVVEGRRGGVEAKGRGDVEEAAASLPKEQMKQLQQLHELKRLMAPRHSRVEEPREKTTRFAAPVEERIMVSLVRPETRKMHIPGKGFSAPKVLRSLPHTNAMVRGNEKVRPSSAPGRRG